MTRKVPDRPIESCKAIRLDEIMVGRRVRRLSPDVVKQIARSMERVGLIVPITVRLRRGDGYWLIAGWHRLEAAKLLGWSTINAGVWKMTALQALLAEIDENLIRAPRSPAEGLLMREQAKELIAARRGCEAGGAA
jgi:ParB family chromosome partitioning protein